MIGLFPAAGRATRLGLPEGQSKEVLEISPGRRAGDCLLQAYVTAGLEAVAVIHREAKRDIEAHYNTHPITGLPLRYHKVQATPSTLHTLCAALRHLPHQDIALGFPDIQFNAADAFVQLKHTLDHSSAEVVLGLFDTDRPDKVDMVRYDNSGAVREIVIKPEQTELTRSWVLAVWRPRFSAWLLDNLEKLAQSQQGELYVGHAFQAVIAKGWKVQCLNFEGAQILDIGTPEDLKRAATFSSLGIARSPR